MKYFLYIIDIIRTRAPKRIIHDLSTAKEPLIDALRKLYLNPARDLAATEAKTLNWSENPFIQAFQDKLAQSLRKFPLTQPDKRHQAAKNAFDEVYKTFCPNGVSLEVPAHSTPNTVAHITARLQPTLENKSPRPASHDIPSPATPGRAIPQDLQPNFKAGFKSSLPELPNLLAAYEEIEDHHLKAVVKKPAIWKCPDSEQTLLDRYESEGIEQAANTEETEDTTEELYRKIMGKK